MTGRIPIPEIAEDITAEWMRRALAAGGAGGAPEFDALEVGKLSDVVNALGNIFRCRLTTADGAPADPASVIVKLPTSNALAFRFAKWMALHRREHIYYRDIAPHTEMRVPKLLYGDLDPRSHRFVLVLEDLGGMKAIPQIEGVGVERARRAIGALAEFQGRFWEATGDPALANCGAFLTTGGSRIMQSLYLLTLPVALQRFSGHFPPDTRRRAVEFGPKIAAHFAATAKGPRTVVHGDFRGDNVLFDSAGGDDFAVIDWQGCGIGCGMHDVAFFLSTSVSIDERRQVERDAVGDYHKIVRRAGAGGYTFEDAWRSYRQNLLGSLMTLVIGAGGIDMSDEALAKQTREILARVLTAVEDADSWEFMPARDRPFSGAAAFSALSRWSYKGYAWALDKRSGKGP